MFPDDAACLRYLERLHRLEGFLCSACGGGGEPWQSINYGLAPSEPMLERCDCGDPSSGAASPLASSESAGAASTLAVEAGVAASTLSAHLARLVDGGLVSVEASGRNRETLAEFLCRPLGKVCKQAATVLRAFSHGFGDLPSDFPIHADHS